MTYFILKSLHLFSMVAWFAGLFYLVRLFVYHVEAFDREEPYRSVLTAQYAIMEDRLFRIICRPAMWMTWIFGVVLICDLGWEWFKVNTWLHVKLVLVFLLSGYTDYNARIIRRLANEERVMDSFKFRLYNEVPTLFLLSIVLLAVFKNLLNFGYTFIALILFGVLLYGIAKWYKKLRDK